MARGTISGFVWGTLLSGMALATASLTAPPPGWSPPAAPASPATTPDPAPAPAPDDSGSEEAPADDPQETATEAPDSSAAPASTGAATDTPPVEDAPSPDSAEAAAPKAGAAEIPAESEFNRGAGDVLPDLPRGEPATSGAPAAPRPAADAGGAAPATQSDSAPAPDVAQSLSQPRVEDGAGEVAPALDGAADPARPEGEAPEVSAPVAEVEPEAPTTPTVAAPTEAQAEQGTDQPAAGEAIDLPAAGFPQGDLDAIGAAPQGAGTLPPESLPTPAEEPAARPRLPQIGAEEETVETTDPSDAAPEVATTAPRLPGQASTGPLTERGAQSATAPEAATPDLPPIEAFAADYDADDPRPRMAIVLIDEGDDRVSMNSLRSFPYPLSFAVDASRPDAALAMQAYRAAGFEVLLRADLPEGATPGDVETAAQTWFAEVPEAVAVMEEGPGLLQRGSETSEQLAEVLADSGHGLLLYPEGLDTARKLAVREGVPAVTLFRDFDAQGEDARVIRRFLDYAALKSEQEGGVVMVGRLRPETVSALLVWGLAERANQVHLVPASAVLTDALPD
ncbi:divergent polysaccharide deacetylase family protein [Ferrimonas balearica]|nr:divergent polysaccharide deacetylase family protein [Ferrimonas balearica]